MDILSKRTLRTLFWLLVPLAAVLGVLYGYFASPRLAAGLDYEVYAQGLDGVAALAFDRDGALYATLERSHDDGQVVRIFRGQVSTVLDDLDKPDGLLLQNDAMYVTNEAGKHGLVVYQAGERRDLAEVNDAEGISASQGGKILVIEDRKETGRLIRLDPDSGRIEVLLDALRQSEGVCESPDGDVYFAVKTADSLQRYAGDGKTAVAASGLAKPAFLNCLADGSVLITEDRTNFGRLLRYRDGRLEVLARHLHSPQSAVIGPDGATYVAEQNRQRILRIYEH